MKRAAGASAAPARAKISETPAPAHCHYLYHNRFAAGPDYEITVHEHLFWHAEFLKAGLLETTVAGERFDTGPGAAILLPPGVPHAFVYREKGTTVFSVKFELHNMELTRQVVCEPPGPVVKAIFAALDSLLQYQRWPSPPKLAAVDHLLAAFVHLAGRRAETDRAQGRLSLADTVKQAVERAEGRPVTAKGLAEQMGFSQAYLREQFLRGEGVSLKTYIDRHRANIAAQYLSYSDVPIKQIVETMEFPDPQCFSRFCRRMTGRSPREIRRAVAGGTNIR